MTTKLFPLDPRKKVRVELYPAEGDHEGLGSSAYQAWKVAHAKAVRQIGSRAADTLKLRLAHHDADKTGNQASDFTGAGVSSDQAKATEELRDDHRKLSRHHVLDTTLKTDLLDWIEGLADWVATSIAKGGDLPVPEDNPENRERLWRSMLNTIILFGNAATAKSTSKPVPQATETPVVSGTNVPTAKGSVTDEPETAAQLIQNEGDQSDPSRMSEEHVEQAQEPKTRKSRTKSPNTSKEGKEDTDEVDQLSEASDATR